MTVMSEDYKYLGFEKDHGVLCAAQVMPKEHSKWIFEKIDNFNDSVI